MDSNAKPAIPQGLRMMLVSRENLSAIVDEISPDLMLVNRDLFVGAARSFLATIENANHREESVL